MLSSSPPLCLVDLGFPKTGGHSSSLTLHSGSRAEQDTRSRSTNGRRHAITHGKLGSLVHIAFDGFCSFRPPLTTLTLPPVTAVGLYSDLEIPLAALTVILGPSGVGLQLGCFPFVLRVDVYMEPTMYGLQYTNPLEA